MFSIVVPAYNEEAIIVDTLKGLRAAEGAPREIILSDDGSTDHTLALARPLVDGVAYWGGSGQKTIGAVRNRGARLAKSDIIAFFDSDVSLAHPETFFVAALAQFERDPQLAALTSSVRVSPQSETWADRVVLTLIDAYYRVANNFFHIGVTHGKCMIVRADVFRRVGGFHEHLIAAEDADLFYRISKLAKTRLDPNLRVYFSGRRAHTIGWPRLLTQWSLNGLSVLFLGRSYSKAWVRAESSRGPLVTSDRS